MYFAAKCYELALVQLSPNIKIQQIGLGTLIVQKYTSVERNESINFARF
jgi:hypothetical protein